ncbi:MAG: energy transducer TonB, partial [Pseudomonadota bacterium]
ILAAAQTLSNGAIGDPGDPRSASTAFETAFMMCRLGDCAGAQAGANFAAAQTAGPNYPSAVDRNVLSAFVAWRADETKKTRRALDEALEAAIAAPINLVTLTAFQTRLATDAGTTSMARIADSATALADHTRQAIDQVGQVHYDARLLAASADFNRSRSKETYLDMVRTSEELEALLNEEDEPDWVKPRRYRALAWELAVESWFVSDNDFRGLEGRADAIRESFETEETETDDGDLPFCPGQLDPSPKPRYPGKDLRRGYVGAVIIGFDVVDGEMTEPEVLAAVPDRSFADYALSAFQKTEWKARPSEDGSPCRSTHRNIVNPVVFTIRG